MGCTSCKTGGKGCNNNGACGINGCSKLHVFDWLANMDLPAGQAPFDKVEIRFKNNRKEFFVNTKKLNLQQGDVVVVEGTPGFDVGVVSVAGELARIQMRRKGVTEEGIKKIYRKATDADLSSWIRAREQENDARLAATQMAKTLNLTMKFSDVEYQGDGTKGIFYYTAPNRVDFRELIVKLSEKLNIRVEMRQINARQEAAQLGGLGNCGRELCCSTWLSDFRMVSQKAARYQSLSINSEKLNGQCGKLKCCLNYELDTYIEAATEFPKESLKLETKNGVAVHAKTDIFKRQVWYTYQDKTGQPIVLDLDRVNEIIELNNKGEMPQDLRDFSVADTLIPEVPVFNSNDAEGDLTRFDKGKKTSKSRKRKAPRPQNQSTEARSGENASPRKPQTNPNPNSADKQRNRKARRRPTNKNRKPKDGER